MYSIRNLASKNPIQIAGVITAALNMLIWLEAPWFRSLTDKQVGGLNTFAILLLGLFVGATTTNNAKLQEVNDAQLQAIDLGKQLAPVTHVTNVNVPSAKVAPVTKAAKKR